MLFSGGLSHFAVINEKLVPFISWMGIECSRTSGVITCFIAAGSLLQLSKCLSVNSSRLYVQNFVLPVFATFPKERSSTRRALSLTKCLTNRGLILYSSIPSRKAFVDEQVISLRTRSLFPLSILRALYIIYLLSTLMLKPITTWKSGCGVLKFLNRSKEQS